MPKPKNKGGAPKSDDPRLVVPFRMKTSVLKKADEMGGRNAAESAIEEKYEREKNGNR